MIPTRLVTREMDATTERTIPPELSDATTSIPNAIPPLTSSHSSPPKVTATITVDASTVISAAGARGR